MNGLVKRKLLVTLLVVVFVLALLLALDYLLSNHAVTIVRVRTVSASPRSLEIVVSNHSHDSEAGLFELTSSRVKRA